MNQDNYVFILLLVATGLMLFISYLSFRKRHLAMAKYSALVMLAASFYSFGYAFEIISMDLASVKFWLKIEYIGIPFISTFWLLLVINFTGYQAKLKKGYMVLLFFIPVVTLILHYTNDFHHYYYRDIRIMTTASNLHVVHLLKGPWYWVHIAYNHLQAIAGMTLFVVAYLKAVPLVRKQILILFLGAAAPWLFNLMYLFDSFGLQLDLTALGFTLSGAIHIWGIYRVNLLRLVPVALQTIYETMQDGVIILDNEFQLTQVNQSARTIFAGLDPLLDYSPACDAFDLAPEIWPKLVARTNSESRITIGDGDNLRHYSMKISLLYDRGHTVLGQMLILSDITQMTAYQDKLLSNANQLAESNAFKDQLFAVVAHDIRDPLAVLMNLTELLEEELKAAKIGSLDIFQEVSEHVRTTYLLVENLLDWFRSQTGNYICRPTQLNLFSVVEQLTSSVKNRSELKKIQISWDMNENLQVSADREMLELVLRNLLSNAVKFTPINGSIHIGAVKDGPWIRVHVRDSGAGVDPETAKTLFREIQQGFRSGTEGEKGTGLGLYLSQNFVRIHGGEIWFESVPGHGSTFFFTIPLAPGAENSKLAAVY